MQLFINQLFEQPAFYAATVVSFAISICIHEYCHALVAHHLGDDTAKDNGYLTMNPFKVMGWLSIIALLLFGISWGAVPVKREDPSRLRRSAISLAGPLSNFILLAICAFQLKILYAHPETNTVYPSTTLFYSRLILICFLNANAVLFLFNILPIPRLDGWGVIEPFLPKWLIPSPKSQTTLFQLFIYLICFSSASGVFDKGLEAFTNCFLPSQTSAMTLVAEGDKCFENRDYTGAYKAYVAAAEAGCPDGQVNYAVCLAEGYGCKADLTKAFAEFSKPTICHKPIAKFYLGSFYLQGNGCAQDFAKAYSFFSDKEVQQNFPLARIRLAELLMQGLGTEKDTARAYHLINEFLNEHSSQRGRDAVMNHQKTKVALPLAEFYMACFLLGGEVCPKDESRAFSLLKKPEVQKVSQEAPWLLGVCYYTGMGTKQDFSLAAKYIKQAADAGSNEARQFLGYQNGKMPKYELPLEEHLKRLWQSQK